MGHSALRRLRRCSQPETVLLPGHDWKHWPGLFGATLMPGVTVRAQSDVAEEHWADVRRLYDAVGPDNMLFSVVGATTVMLLRAHIRCVAAGPSIRLASFDSGPSFGPCSCFAAAQAAGAPALNLTLDRLGAEEESIMTSINGTDHPSAEESAPQGAVRSAALRPARCS